MCSIYDISGMMLKKTSKMHKIKKMKNRNRTDGLLENKLARLFFLYCLSGT